MITVFDAKTGEPIKLDGVDARERINAGLAVRSLDDVQSAEKPASKPKKGLTTEE